jgi:plastocyanin
MRMMTACVSAIASTLLVGAAARAAQLSGRIELTEGGRAVRSEEVRDAVVYFKPRQAAAERPDPRVHDIVMRRKEFVPHVVALTVGSSVRFPNSDPILHNVFSVSGGNAFDLGLYPQGPGKTATFSQAGLVRVFCNVHHDMVAYVVVLDTPWYAAPGPDGAFTLDGLPESDGLLVVWHERAEAWKRELRVPTEAPLAVQVELTKPRAQPHPDKTGKPYGATSRERDYR